MMTNCQNETLRDLLPLLAHDALGKEEATTVRAHLASCTDCAAEWRTLTAASVLFEGATPQVDTAAILSKLAAGSRARSVHRREPASVRPRRMLGMPRAALAAAASLVLMATLSITVLRPIFLAGSTGSDRVTMDSIGDTNAQEPAHSVVVASVGGTTLRELGVDELTQLLNELDQLEATIAAEPRTLSAPITNDSEGM